MNPTVNAGSGKRFKLQADRFDEFDGDIRIDITGLPPGFAVSTPLVIQAGHLEAVGVLSALAWRRSRRRENAAASKITATARIDGHEVTKVVGSLGQIKLAAEPPLIARLEPTTSSSVATSGRSPTMPKATQHWVVLEPTSALSKAGATLTKQADQSVLAGGVNPANDSYTVVATTDAKNIRAVRLEVLGDKSLPDGAPGRGDGNGNFVLTEFRLTAAPRNDFAKARAGRVRIGRSRLRSARPACLGHDRRQPSHRLGNRRAGPKQQVSGRAARRRSIARGHVPAKAARGLRGRNDPHVHTRPTQQRAAAQSGPFPFFGVGRRAAAAGVCAARGTGDHAWCDHHVQAESRPPRVQGPDHVSTSRICRTACGSTTSA